MKKFLIITAIFLSGTGIASAITNIDAFEKYAWNDSVGWLNFYDFSRNTQNEVIVTGTRLKGSGVIQTATDYVSLDCETSPNPVPDENICATSFNYYVSNDDNGNLAGWAWSDSIGWVSFCGNATGGSTHNGTTWVCPASPTYQVLISSSGPNRDFSGYAWNDSVGWISFNNCQPSCGGIAYKVRTYWGSPGTPQSGDLTSSTINTCPSGDIVCIGGVAYNYILWQGTLNGSSNSVKFQLATSNCENGATDPDTCAANPGWGGTKTSGDGAFVGPNGFASSFYGDTAGTTLPAVPTSINNLNHNNKRYYRYKIFITKSEQTTLSPVIQDVIVNWSL